MTTRKEHMEQIVLARGARRRIPRARAAGGTVGGRLHNLDCAADLAFVRTHRVEESKAHFGGLGNLYGLMNYHHVPARCATALAQEPEERARRAMRNIEEHRRQRHRRADPRANAEHFEFVAKFHTV